MDCAIDRFSGELSNASPRDIFSAMPGGYPGWYARRVLTTDDVARALGRDASTIRQRAVARKLTGIRASNGWRFSWRDVSDYVHSGQWRASTYRRWTVEEKARLASGKVVAGRTAEAARKAMEKINKAGGLACSR